MGKARSGETATLAEMREDIHEFKAADETTEAPGQPLSPTEAARAKVVRVQLPFQPYALVESLGDAKFRVTIPAQEGVGRDPQPTVEVVANSAVEAYNLACGVTSSTHKHDMREVE